MKRLLVFVATLFFSTALFAQSADLLFLQMANRGTIVPSAKNTYTVTINHPAAYVSYFSDRPQRKYGAMPLTKFIEFWSNKHIKDNFAQNPPNAAVVLVNNKMQTQSFIAEVTKPELKNDQLSYTIKLLNSKQKINNETLKHVTFFFDHIHWNPGGF